MILNVHDKRNWIQPKDGEWIDGSHSPGIEIYNDPVEIIFRKNDSSDRRDLVIKHEGDDWYVIFYEDNKEVDATLL
jgi:hypothetical protein